MSTESGPPSPEKGGIALPSVVTPTSETTTSQHTFVSKQQAEDLAAAPLGKDEQKSLSTVVPTEPGMSVDECDAHIAQIRHELGVDRAPDRITLSYMKALKM